MKYISLLVTLSAVCMLICCDSSKERENVTQDSGIEDVAVQVVMEGKSFAIKQNDLEHIVKNQFKQDSLQLVFWEDGNPLKLNFNLFNTDILSKGSAVYNIPDINSPKQKVDLNFFNKDRAVKSTNKRIIFRKGTITILKLTDKELQMTFKGEGSGALEYGKNVPISGSVNVKFK